MGKTAVILAGGRGTRLRPYTVVLPKPLMPIGDYPILEVIIRQLAHSGFTRVILAVNHQAQLIQAYFADGSKWGINIEYSLEIKPLSTMGPLKLIDDLPTDFLVMNGDILTDFDFSNFLDEHVKKANHFTIASSQRQQASEYGVLHIDESSKLYSFSEKPVLNYDVSMGIYAINKSILDYIPKDTFYGFDNLMLALISEGSPANVFKYNGFWLDIGRADDYYKAIEKFDSMKDVFLKCPKDC